MKYELKIEFSDSTQLDDVIKSSYFSQDMSGKLIGKKSSLEIPSSNEHFKMFKGLNNITVKIINHDMIDGSMRCVVNEASDKIELYPCNNYCEIEDGKYSFY